MSALNYEGHVQVHAEKIYDLPCSLKINGIRWTVTHIVIRFVNLH